MISNVLNQKIHFYLTCLLVFFMPIYPKILPILIILLTANWVINPKNIKLSYKTITNNFTFSTTAILYILYLIGILYSSNLNFGIKVVETKMSLLIFPLIYGSYINFTKEKMHHYLKFFTYGCIIYTLICLSYATYAYFKPVYIIINDYSFNLGANYFYYTYLSVFFHPSYTAMYSVFALSIIFIELKKGVLKLNWIVILSIFLLTIFVLLLSSKAGWITLFILYTYVIVWLISLKKFISILYFTIPLTIAFLVFNVYYSPNVSQRIPKVESIKKALFEKDQNNEVVTTSNDGNATRIFVWKASTELFLQNFLFGTGTGDSKEELLKKYLERGMTTEHQNELNSHNQFLNTAIALGVVGLVILLLSLLFPLYLSLTNKNYIITAFLIIVSFNMLFESMLERQTGVVFYAFFNTLLCSTFVHNKKIKI